MSPSDLKQIEESLGIKLPAPYKRLMVPFPVPYLGGNADTDLWDDPEELVARNKELRTEWVRGFTPWPKYWLFIGDPLTACGHAIDIRDADAHVHWVDHCDLNSVEGEPGQPFEDWLSDWVAKVRSDLESDGIDPDGLDSEAYSNNCEAVFTSDFFDHPAHHEAAVDEENFDEQYPCAGRELALALEDAFAKDNPYHSQTDKSSEREPCSEHGAWVLSLDHEGRTFTIYLWPIPTDAPWWWLSVSENRGCLMTLFGLGNSDRIPRALQRRLQTTVEKIAKAKDFRWTTEEKVKNMF